MAIADDCQPVCFLTTKAFLGIAELADKLHSKDEPQTRRAIDLRKHRWRSTDDIVPLEPGRGWEFPSYAATSPLFGSSSHL